MIEGGPRVAAFLHCPAEPACGGSKVEQGGEENRIMIGRLWPQRRCVSGWLMLGALLAAPLWAQESRPPATVPAEAPTTRPATRPTTDLPTIQRLFQRLADRDAAARDDARRRLMGLGSSDLPLLQQVVRQSQPLLPAQVAALHDVVMQVFLAGETYPASGEQGFLGIGMGAPALTGNWGQGEEGGEMEGVVVLSRFPGFPGYRWLLDGDVIVGVKSGNQSQRISASQGLSNAISGQPGGATVTLEVQRHGRLLEVPLTLAPMPQAAMPAPGAANRFESFQGERLQRAEAYWDRFFAPLMRQNML
jgi:hypothetical protein